ncbi:MAG: Holliday junction branch migration protein RuvA [Candidatus Peribacteraceae bacterium]|nr:Holliday junction branch migration protein RuvA [Candidatus Peribacteraceae bacterium]|tara:strand:+ start:18797 stop:19375 length:579 start_codon:yes stop_codon:yes gene_type:complete
MISHLRGTVHRRKPEEITVDVNGVGYGVSVPITVWDELKEGKEATLYISTYVREDRLALFGFLDDAGRILFERFIGMTGIGPKHALELSAVPKSLLMQAIGSQEPKLLTSVKGIGKKTAEKLLVDLKALAQKQPEIFGAGDLQLEVRATDQDVIDALKNLGYDTSSILNVLKNLPREFKTTEERVAAALRSI